MLLLALETGGEVCGAALGRDGAVIAACDRPMERGHAEALAPIVHEVLAAAGVGPGAIDGIALTIGPGSFTGLRVGLAFARAWALAARIGLVPVTALEALAEAVEVPPRLAVIDARRGQVYEQRFATDRVSLGPPAVVDRTAEHGRADDARGSSARAWLVTGPGVIAPVRPAASLVLRAAQRALARGARPQPGETVMPLYLRGADADPAAGRALVQPY